MDQRLSGQPLLGPEIQEGVDANFNLLQPPEPATAIFRNVCQ
jgi:hypothetical protein